jgi:nucleotide-binding universal stress UspA family protein
VIKDITSKSEQKQPVTHDTKLNRVLVVISPDLVKPGAPQDSVLLNRAVALAKATGCELELFHVCHDSSLLPAFFDSAVQMQRERETVLDRDATLMAEIVARLNSEGVTMRHDTRWDAPRSAAILRKIDEVNPDLVMKQSREYGYVMGLMGNTDWDLIRQSPAHLWFVSENGSNDIERIVTAVGASTDRDEMIAAEDYSVFRFANHIADSFDGINYPVHAYQIPPSIRSFAAYAPEFGSVAHPAPAGIPAGQTRSDVARKHGKAIQSFADYFHLNLERVSVVEGPASVVIPEVAEELHANLVVMAARQLSRWERLFRSVTAEPVLSAAPCDVVFIKNPDDVYIPEARKAPLHGMPMIDMEKAVLDPQRVFGSPHALVTSEALSVSMRQRILQIWEQDVRAQMREEDEGGTVQSTKANILNSIISARSFLNPAAEREPDEAAELTH